MDTLPMTTLDDRNLRLHCWFATIFEQAEHDLASGAAPDWLRERFDQGEVRRAVKEAGLPHTVAPGIAALMLALFAALKASKPRANAEVRKGLKGLINRARSLHRALEPDKVMADTASATLCDFTSTELPDRSVELSWIDPIAELQTALDLFIERALQVELPAHQGGTRLSTTTLAAIVLVGLAIEYNSGISAAPLARLAARLFDTVIVEYEVRFNDEVDEPDWHDRISANLAERRAPKSTPAEK